MVFDPIAELAALHQQTRSIRKKIYRCSRLDRHASELLTLRRNGASAAELQRWLRARRVKVAHSTVARWLARSLSQHDHDRA